MKIKVINWDSHQERADRGNYVWFKFYNAFWEDEKIHSLKPSAKLLFVYLLTLCSKASRDTVDYIPSIAAALIGTGQLPVADLEAAGLIACQENAVTSPPRGEEKRIDIRLDLEQIYQLYPRRTNQRKHAGLARLRSTVKTDEDFAACQRAAANYAKYCEAEAKDPKYIKQFGTWAGEWREWVEMDPPMLKKGDWHG